MARTSSLTYLHIEDKYEEISKDIKVDIPTSIIKSTLDGDKLSETDIIQVVKGISNAVLSRYINNIKSISSQVHLMIPVPIDKDILLKAYEAESVEEAKTKVDDIFLGLSEQQKAILLNHIQNIKSGPTKSTKDMSPSLNHNQKPRKIKDSSQKLES